MGWAPQRLAEAQDDLVRRVLDLYTHRDPALARALKAGMTADQLAQGNAAMPQGGGDPGKHGPRRHGGCPADDEAGRAARRGSVV